MAKSLAQTDMLYQKSLIKQWEARAVQRTVMSEMTSRQLINRVIPMYEETLRDIERELKELYLQNSNGQVLDVAKLREKLVGNDRKKVLLKLKEKITLAGYDYKKVLNKDFLYKLDRLEGFRQYVYWSVKDLVPEMTISERKYYSDIIKQAYALTREDNALRMMYKGVGLGGLGNFKGYSITGGFNIINEDLINKILEDDFLGSNYEIRTNTNIGEFAGELRNILGMKAITGMSIDKTSKIIHERFGVAERSAVRLIRTESMHFSNQAELKGYEDDGIEYYRYVATLDNRTSKICRGMNGTIWKLSEAVEGYNYPPLHSNCRSTTVAIFGDEIRPEMVMESRYKRSKDYTYGDILEEVYKGNERAYRLGTGESLKIGKK